MKVSLILSCFNKAQLLLLTLSSIVKYQRSFELEVVIVDDGKLDDGTKDICNQFGNTLDIKYIFTGQRHSDKLISRNPAFPNNIGVKNCSGDIIVLSCPEICHLNNALELLVQPLMNQTNILSIPERLYWDNNGDTIKKLQNKKDINLIKLFSDRSHIYLPFFMGMWKKEFVSIGGYDEDFTGHAAEDEDLVNRLLNKGLTFHKTKSQVVHLFHGNTHTTRPDWNNPKWVHNYKLFQKRLGTINRNVGRDWGSIK